MIIVVSKSFAALVLFLPPHLLLHSFLFYVLSLSCSFPLHPSFPLTLVSQEKLCLPHHILEEKGLVKVSITVQALMDVASSRHTLLTWERWSLNWLTLTTNTQQAQHADLISWCHSGYFSVIKVYLLHLRMPNDVGTKRVRYGFISWERTSGWILNSV